jgi:hypothetical protein
VFFLLIVASIDLLSVVPANVYGYACGVLAAPAIRRAGHRPIAEPGLALLRQPAGLAHCLDGDRSPVRLCLGPAREGAAQKTAEQGVPITEARRFVPGPNSGIDSRGEGAVHASVFFVPLQLSTRTSVMRLLGGVS